MKTYTNKDTVSEICIVAPSKDLAERCINIIEGYKLDIEVYEAYLEDGLVCAKELIEKGAKIIISRKGTRILIEENCDISIVDMPIMLSDYIPFYNKVVGKDLKIAFFNYKYDVIPEEVLTMNKFFNLNVVYYEYETETQCKKVVLDAIKNNVDFGVGGHLTKFIAKNNNLEHLIEHLIIEGSDKAVEVSINTALQLLKLQKDEYDKQLKLRILNEQYKNVFDYSHDSIIAIDKDGKVNLINKNAEKLFKKRAKDCIGKRIDKIIANVKLLETLNNGEKVLGELVTIDGELILTNRVPIVIDGVTKGAIATFQSVEEFLNNEQKIRIELKEKGLYAKATFDDIIGESASIKESIKIANIYAKSDHTILLTGETGTGKELFAQSIHNASLRNKGPFVAINCSSIPKDLLESELFGYVEGAFTGAIKGGKRGVFELSYGGTLFLDEIGEISENTQVQLLRVIQEKEIRKIGGEKIIPIDVRIIVATNKDMQALVREKKFREDLYYRINVLSINIPPLRDREEDAFYLMENMFKKLDKDGNMENDINLRFIMNTFYKYSWPGNVRELQNLVNRAHILLKQGMNQKEILQIINTYVNNSEIIKDSEENFTEIENWEKQEIINSLIKNNLVLNKTAKDLGISRTTLWRKIKEYQIKMN